MAEQRKFIKEEIGKPMPFEVGCLDTLGLSPYIMQTDQQNIMFIVCANDTPKKDWDMLRKSKVEIGIVKEGSELMIVVAFKGAFKTKAIYAAEFDAHTFDPESTVTYDLNNFSEENITRRRWFFLRILNQRGEVQAVHNICVSHEFSHFILENIADQGRHVKNMAPTTRWISMPPRALLKEATMHKPEQNTRLIDIPVSS